MWSRQYDTTCLIDCEQHTLQTQDGIPATEMFLYIVWTDSDSIFHLFCD